MQTGLYLVHLFLGQETRQSGSTDWDRHAREGRAEPSGSPGGVMTDTLMGAFSPDKSKLEFNNAAEEALVSRLRDPLQQDNIRLSDEQLRKLVSAIRTF